VSHSWDRVAGLVAPKSRAAERTVPIPAQLRALLIEHELRQPAARSDFVFAIASGSPFDPPNVLRVARRHWKLAGLAPISFHECRHSYASFMIAAGVNAKALSVFMGHSSIQITLDRYGHLMPGSEREAAELLDEYLVEKAS
jgi:integrase